MHSGHEFIQIAKRENNNKRNYLLVNSLQGSIEIKIFFYSVDKFIGNIAVL